MKLGGHETFYLRPGWLTKGVLHLEGGAMGVFSTPEAADQLGVGRNMAKSIGWWLLAMGLARRSEPSAPLRLTELGVAVARHDPFMSALGTWWLLHASAVTAETGTTLRWFASHRRPDRFDRAALVEALQQDLSGQKGKAPAVKSIQREVATVLQAYAVPVPRPRGDPEDNLGSPLHRLDLFRHLRSTDRFERSRPTPAPPEALGLVLSAHGLRTSCDSLTEGIVLDIPVAGPEMVAASTALGLSREAAIDLATEGGRLLGADRIAVRFLASERVVTVRSGRADTWAELFYRRQEVRSLGDAA